MQSFDLDVSRETIERLERFEELIRKWTAKINLISRPSIPDIWDRHIVDSVQIYRHAPSFHRWVDLGSGGGLPGIVVAVIAKEKNPDGEVILVESDQRKATFLRAAIRELGLNAEVISQRIEGTDRLNADVVSARALADIKVLLGYCLLHLADGGCALLQKGEKWQKEHTEAQALWSYDCEPIMSVTNSAAAILKIKDIKHV